MVHTIMKYMKNSVNETIGFETYGFATLTILLLLYMTTTLTNFTTILTHRTATYNLLRRSKRKEHFFSETAW